MGVTIKFVNFIPVGILFFLIDQYILVLEYIDMLFLVEQYNIYIYISIKIKKFNLKLYDLNFKYNFKI